ncbi:MAG: CBS domain-containing protein, partial [Nitrospirota bacterium]
MKLNDLLRTKPAKIVTCRDDNTIREAVDLMDGKEVGSVLVMDDGGDLKGIFTERDVLRCVAREVDFDTEKITGVMSKNPVQLDASADIEEAANVMSKGNFRHLPVNNGKELIGMVSYRDLVSYLLPEVIFSSEE